LMNGENLEDDFSPPWDALTDDPRAVVAPSPL
jgi:hypothetical protein